MDIISVLIGGLGISFGLTAFTVLSVRSEKDTRLVVGTYLWTTAAVTAIFAWAKLPPDLAWQVGVVGVAVGGLCIAILMIARFVERKYEAS